MCGERKSKFFLNAVFPTTSSRISKDFPIANFSALKLEPGSGSTLQG